MLTMQHIVDPILATQPEQDRYYTYEASEPPLGAYIRCGMDMPHLA